MSENQRNPLDYLSKNIKEGMEHIDKEGGLEIEQLEPNTLINLTTQSGSEYQILVVDPQKHRVILKGTSPRFKEPQEGVLMGSTFGGSTLKVGFLGNGVHLEIFLTESRKTMTTSPVTSYEIEDNEELKNELLNPPNKIN